MQLIENEKTEVSEDAVADRALAEPGEQQFEHHVIGEQDLRRLLAHFCALGFVFLTGVLAKGNRERFAGGLLVIGLIAFKLIKL